MHYIFDSDIIEKSILFFVIWKEVLFLPKKFFIHKFGCQLNFADAEKMEGILLQEGFEKSESDEEADLILLCTCAVRESAENRVYGFLGELKKYKEKKSSLKIGLCGCMANEEVTVQKIKKSYPYVDLVFGTGSISNLPEMVDKLYNGNIKKYVADINEYLPDSEDAMPHRQSTFRAFVPVMYGCNNFCTYCIVPYTRGRERSRTPESIIDEIKKLIKSGYKEIFLLGQNVNSYGKDLEKKITFAELLQMINDIEGDFWIRFLSSHPKDASNELIDIVKADNKIEPHFHLPVQSGSSKILKDMNRHYSIDDYMKIIDYLRKDNPEFSITTDIIVGFPNESDAEFEETISLIEKVKYDNIFSFIYSKRSGTKAAGIDDKISASEKSGRMQKMLEIQRNITSESYKRFIGKTYKVLTDGVSKKGLPLMTGKNHEGIIVEFEGDESMTGKFVNVKITSSANWAVKGEIVNLNRRDERK